MSKTWGFCSISKNDGRRGKFEQDLQRCIFRGRRSTRDVFIRAVRRSRRWCGLQHGQFRFEGPQIETICRFYREVLLQHCGWWCCLSTGDSALMLRVSFGNLDGREAGNIWAKPSFWGFLMFWRQWVQRHDFQKQEQWAILKLCFAGRAPKRYLKESETSLMPPLSIHLSISLYIIFIYRLYLSHYL